MHGPRRCISYIVQGIHVLSLRGVVSRFRGSQHVQDIDARTVHRPVRSLP